jgi:hypothetical protein
VGSITSGGDAGVLAPLTTDWTTIALGDADFVDVRTYGLGRVAAVGDEGILTNPSLLDNAVFGANLMAWLDQPGQRHVVFSGGHGEVSTSADGALGSELSRRDFTTARVRGTITDDSLAGASVLVIGNAQNSFTAAEIQAVSDFVANGGGLLLLGNGAGKTAADYPMNKMAQPFGMIWPAAASSANVFRTFYPNVRQ